MMTDAYLFPIAALPSSPTSVLISVASSDLLRLALVSVVALAVAVVARHVRVASTLPHVRLVPARTTESQHAA